MRLLNIYTLDLKVFDDDEVKPLYIIVSHKWGSTEDEVTFEGVRTGAKKDSPGYRKIEAFCAFLRKRNAEIEPWRKKNPRDKPTIDWLWIDTCCIDQRSSADVHEAINSMWKWYRRGHICYAYLSDVDGYEIANSIWFTRGWTLQEFLAPRKVVFLNSTWNIVGHKCPDVALDLTGCRHRRSGPVLNGKISHVTGNARSMKGWMGAKQKNKEKEDMAYCLLGICGVFMTLIYGEGSNAWKRLEEEVSKKYKQHVQLDTPNSLRGSSGYTLVR